MKLQRIACFISLQLPPNFDPSALAPLKPPVQTTPKRAKKTILNIASLFKRRLKRQVKSSEEYATVSKFSKVEM